MEGPALKATINGVELSATDELYETGKVAILSDNPALFYSVEVTANEAEAKRISTREASGARQSIAPSIGRSAPRTVAAPSKLAWSVCIEA